MIGEESKDFIEELIDRLKKGYTEEKNIYLISDGEYQKIGKSCNLKNRLSQLQTSNPKKLKILISFPESIISEEELHDIFSKYRIRNEWFKIPKVFIEYFILFMNLLKLSEARKKDAIEIIEIVKEKIYINCNNAKEEILGQIRSWKNLKK